MRIFSAIIALGYFLVPIAVHAQAVTQPFTFNIVFQELPTVHNGSVSWGDIDGDGDLDAYVGGERSESIISAVYINEGEGADGIKQFSLATSDLNKLAYSTSSFADIDGDGDLDLLISGSKTLDYPYASATSLYRNDGGAFVEISSSGLHDLHSSSASWGDLDSDGDLDLVMTGVTSSDDLRTVISLNSGDGTFSSDSDLLVGIGYGDSDLGDIDGDLDLDIVLSGASADGFITSVLRNDGGSFSTINSGFSGYAFSSVDLGDYDNDGDLDLVISGGQVSPLILDGGAEIWENSGGSFTRVETDFKGILAGDVTWGDYDNDGDLDLLTLGAEQAIGRRSARIFRNSGDGTLVNSSLLVGTIFGDADWGDFDGDGDLDLLTTGRTTMGPSITNLYENQRQIIPPIPAAPSSLISEVVENQVQLSWLSPGELIEANSSLTYNVRVGLTPGGSEIVTAMAHPETGQLLLAHPGNAAASQELVLDGLQNGTYYWTVQSVNHAFLSSSFASEGTFSINGAHSVDSEDDSFLPQQFAVYSNYPNPFSSRTTVRFDLPTSSNVEFRVYSLLGQEVTRIVRGTLSPGQHQVDWDGRSSTGSQLGSGIYFYELRADDRLETGTMTLVR